MQGLSVRPNENLPEVRSVNEGGNVVRAQVNDKQVTCPDCLYKTRLMHFDVLLVGDAGVQAGCRNCRYSFWVSFT